VWARVDRDRCISSGRCVVSAPEVFDQDDEGLALTLRPELGPGDEAAVREAEFLCPARAISTDLTPR
jgi:ferredoxin